MALLCKYEFDGMELNNAYIRIISIRTSNSDYEEYVEVDDPTQPNIAMKLEFVKRIESSATAFVWYDQIARENRVVAEKWFDFKFDYDLESDKNIYEQAYLALKATDRFADAVDV